MFHAFSLLLGLCNAKASSDVHTQESASPIHPTEDVWAGNARFVQDRKLFNSINKRKLFMTDDPDFALAHQLSSIGVTTIVVGGITTVGTLAVTLMIGIWTILDDDKTPVQKGLRVAGYSALSVVGGAGVSFVGSSIARNVLISKGEQVSFAGGYLATTGVISMFTGFGLFATWNDVEPSDTRQDIGGILMLGGLTAIPAGLITQHIINRVSYNRLF